MHSSEIDKKLLSSRKELLDVSLRNNMLNVQLRKNSLSIKNTLSVDVLKALYIQNKCACFVNLSESSEFSVSTVENENDATQYLLNQLNTSHTLFTQNKLPKALKRNSLELPIDLKADVLWLNLLKMQTHARTYIQEQGVNLLFLTLGCLHWFDNDTPNVLRKAPLLFMPVQLKKQDNDGFYLECTGDDLFENACLSLKLKTDFNLSLPKYMHSENSNISNNSNNNEDLPELDVFFNYIKHAIQGQNKWIVDANEIYLGFFSFGKFLMFNDLDVEKWPAHKNPCDHPILHRLLGEHGFINENTSTTAFLNIEHETQLDDILANKPLHLVTDADSSQTKAILKARTGCNLIIQGPPGTGKSQTITNIIADCLAQQKTVLFVAEKMAALDVVKNRLDEASIGNAVLELHSHKTNKQNVLQEIGKSIEYNKQSQTKAGGQTTNINNINVNAERLFDIQNNLNQYVLAVNTPIAQSNVSFIEALGHYLKLKHILYGDSSQVEHWTLNNIHAYTPQDYQNQHTCIQDMAMHLEKIGIPYQHVFWGSECTQFGPADRNQIEQLLTQSIQQITTLQQACAIIAKNLSVAVPVTLSDTYLLCEAAQSLFNLPQIEGVDVQCIDWKHNHHDIYAFIQAGKYMQALRKQYQPMFLDIAWQQNNILQDRQNLAYYGDKWWRNLSGSYRKSLARLKGLCKEPLLNLHDCRNHLSLIDAILDYQKHNAIYAQYINKGKQWFGKQWKDIDSNWLELEKMHSSILQLHTDIAQNRLPENILQALQKPINIDTVKQHVLSIKNNYSAIQVNILDLYQKLGLNLNINNVNNVNNSSNITIMRIDDLHHRLYTYAQNLDGIYDITRFNQLHKQLLDFNLLDAAEQSIHWSRPAPDFVHLFNFSWYDALIMMAYDASPHLREFNRSKHEELIKQFVLYDQESIINTQKNLVSYLSKHNLHKHSWGEADILQHELHKKRRHMPIRQLIAQAGRAIQKIKPVFMMSPMSIANFLAPGELEFDVVIFDEASQVKTVDALGAILRGKQVIVVGDTQQMPPSDFFNRDIEIEDTENITNDIESILSMFRARGAQECYLKWHYRSKDPSLIAVSNFEFYQNQLVIFPSPHINTSTINDNDNDKDKKGLSLSYMPHAVYDRGNTKTNIDEAKAVVQAILEHALHYPFLSLGVIAFSIAQRDLIQLELEILKYSQPKLAAFLNNTHHNTESSAFFIKNLENVQGDERDVILVSIAYGRNASGNIAQNFGPLNYKGGERRLNVLMTRAKLAMRIFCNFHAHDLHIDDTSKHGIRALKHFLSYAETRILNKDNLNKNNNDNKDIILKNTALLKTNQSFEQAIMQALQKQGYHVDANVGVSGYFIDLAIKDKDSKDEKYAARQYILGIECDGGNYASAHSARDRDRLRPHILANMGWRIHRIWSTDWLRHPQREIELIVSAIDIARKDIANNFIANKNNSQTNTIVSSNTEIVESPFEILEPCESIYAENIDNIKQPIINAQAYEAADLHEKFNTPTEDIYSTSIHTLLEYINYILIIEGPIHEQLLSKRLLSFYGITRSGSRITAKISEALLIGVAQTNFFYAHNFLYKNKEACNTNNITIRNRLALPSIERKIEWIAPEEIDKLILNIIAAAFSIKTDKAFLLMLNHLGIGKLTTKIKTLFVERIQYLVANKQLIYMDDIIKIL